MNDHAVCQAWDMIDRQADLSYNRRSMRLFPTPAYRDVPELLDEPGRATPQDLAGTLRDIRRANIFGLGTWVVLRHLNSLLRDYDPRDTVRILDLATGSGDIPEEVCRWARRRGWHVEIVLTDISEEIVRVARKRIERAGFGESVSFVACDATSVPFADRSFDVTICSLAFHHLGPDQAVTALREMKRVSRVGYIVNDIYRSQGAWYVAWLLTRLTTGNRLTRHDGPASVLRAFTPRELFAISHRAGVCARVFTHPFWRMALVGKSSGPVL